MPKSLPWTVSIPLRILDCNSGLLVTMCIRAVSVERIAFAVMRHRVFVLRSATLLNSRTPVEMPRRNRNDVNDIQPRGGITLIPLFCMSVRPCGVPSSYTASYELKGIGPHHIISRTSRISKEDEGGVYTILVFKLGERGSMAPAFRQRWFE